MKYLLRSMEDPNQFINIDTFWMRWLGCGYREQTNRWEVARDVMGDWNGLLDPDYMKARELDDVYKQCIGEVTKLKFSNHDGEYVAGKYVFPQKSLNESTKDLWTK